MDSFAVVRELARQLRTSLERQHGPLTGPEAIRIAIKAKEFDLYELSPTDPLLNGCDAVLDRPIASVYVRNDRSVEERTALAAHEIGHLELHDIAHDCPSCGIDLSTPEEASPVGIDRIEQYGVRERRELQANVFGREFLLPRDTARHLFLNEACRASTIATSLQLPLNVVRQQLCDSLLLPDALPLTTASALDNRPLDHTQQIVAEHEGSPLRVDAGPGTGKTRALVARIVHLIRKGVHPSAILALTFSNKAALEITERVTAVLPQAAPHIWAGTFHAFGLELLRRYYHLFGLEPEVRVSDRSDAIEMLEERLPLLGLVHYQNLYEPALELKEILSAISRAKDELVDADTYTSLAQTQHTKATNDDERIAAEKALEVARVYAVYEQTLVALKAVDFGDLIMKPTLLLEAQPALRDAVGVRHRHILVDEYQDVNRASARLLKALAGTGERLWVVGDARQSIYRFRGASSVNFALFSQDFNDARHHSLGINYRSTQEIVDTFTGFAQTMQVSQYTAPLSLRSQRGGNGLPPSISVASTPEEEVSLIAGEIMKLQRDGVAFRDQAVLCRTNKRVSESAEGLEARGIPVLHLGSLFEREEVRNLLSLLSFVVDRKGSGLVRMASFPTYRIPLQDVQLFLRTAEDQQIAAVQLLQELPSIDGLSAAGVQGFAQLAADLQGIEPKSMPWQILVEYLFERRAFLQAVTSHGTVSAVLQGIALYQFLTFVRGYTPHLKGFPSTNLLEQVRRLVLLGDERDLRQLPASALGLDAVRLSTIHGSKGLEFEAIHIPSLMTTGIPSNFRFSRCPPPLGLVSHVQQITEKDVLRALHEEEEECLFFVALSRTKTHLRLYRSLTVGATMQNRNPSPFLDRISTGLIDKQGVEGVHRAVPLDDGTIRLEALSLSSVQTKEVVDFELCPRRYLYNHILRLTGTTRESAFRQTHRCLYAAIEVLRTMPPEDTIDEHRLLQAFENAWLVEGPLTHGFATDYKELAYSIIHTLALSLQGLQRRERKDLTIDLTTGCVIVRPDHVASLPDGRVLLRFIRTGRKSSAAANDTIHGAYQEAAKRTYGEGRFTIELLYLTDGAITEVNLTKQKMRTHITKMQSYLDDITNGRFPADPDGTKCPRCPYFFICPAMPPFVSQTV